MTFPDGRGWFKAMGGEASELMLANPLAFVLAYVIADRAKWQDGFSGHGLGQGEAMLGDYRKCGMTHQQYRTAKSQLSEWGFPAARTGLHTHLNAIKARIPIMPIRCALTLAPSV